ncbi:Late endosome and vacuole interface protein 10 [Candida viswanathii]|uniref:Late endosome and vacuole interface protein 10 n=1 Tax=Candida viswanathii TaxID=5486 RepID=A0A367XSU7_9ASCO|nr:Late endosome and vacuole interface protein 10 [Candida viswanathii]
MASASAKKQASSNVAMLNQLALISGIINLLALLAIFVLGRPASFKPWLFWSVPSFLLHYSLESSGRPTYSQDGKNLLIRSGEDIRLKGSLFEYYFDVIYITWFLDIAMIVLGSNKVWYAYLIIPGFAVYKLSGFILPFIKKNKGGDAGAEAEQAQKGGNSATSKRQQKLQARREKGPAVKYR